MDYTELLPPLPEPDLGMPWRVNAKSDGVAHSAGFTDAQLHAYALAAIAAAAPAIRRAEGERAAALCDLMRDRSLGAQSGDPSDLSNVMLRQVAELGWGQAAEAIRALPEEP